MNNEHDRESTSNGRDSERRLERLFAHAKPRPMPPAAVTEEIRQAIYAEWDAVTGRRVWLRRAGALAATAAAFALVFWAAVAVNPPQSLPMLASVERVQGVADMRLGDELPAGAVVASRSGHVALRLASGGSLRLGPQTRLQLTSSGSVELTAGVVYFDSEDGRAGQPLTITTTLGTVRDVGTQFMVRVAPERLEVGVRQGRVAFTRDAEQRDAAAGDKLVVAAASIRRESMDTFGDEWAWVERVAPPFDIDGRMLSDFLTWFQGQTGRTVVFADPAAERLAREAILNGSIDLEPLPKLAAVLTLTDLSYSLEGERVVIAVR